jgi:hypothetical protein
MHMAKRTKKTLKRARTKAPTKGKKRAARPAPAQARPQRINAQLKGLAQALEPPINANPADLLPAFWGKLQAALAQLHAANTPFKLVEGFRTVDRQQWLYGSGRPALPPYGRPGPILTNADGVNTKSKHQGDGTPVTGVAADCYPMKDGKVYVPPSSDPIWNVYATAVEAQGLVAGYRWPKLKDSPHCEMP